MQIRQIKILMLILFVLLDIFLFNWWRAGEISGTQVSDANADMITEMRNQNIKLPSFSRTVKYSSYIAAEKMKKDNMSKLPNGLVIERSNDETELVARIKVDKNQSKQSSGSSDNSTIKKIADEFGYTYNPISTAQQNNDNKIYSQSINGLPVLSSAGTLTFNHSKDGFTNLTKRELTNIQKLRDDRPTITEEEAIVALYRYNEINSGDVLSSGDLFYYQSLSVNGYDIYLPVWAFNVEKNHQKSILKINAFTGDNLTE